MFMQTNVFPKFQEKGGGGEERGGGLCVPIETIYYIVSKYLVVRKPLKI